MKNYLNRTERDNFLLALELTTHIRKVMSQWENNLTTNEKRRIKSSVTNIENALASISTRLPAHEVKKIMKYAKDFQVRVLSVEGAKALEKSSKQEYEKNLHISYEEMEMMATQILTNNCYYCNISCSECGYYNMLMRFLVPGANAEDNCPFAYRESSKFNFNNEYEASIYKEAIRRNEIKKEIKEYVKEEKAKEKLVKEAKAKTKSKKKSRHDKKYANRYNDDSDIYTYNIAK